MSDVSASGAPEKSASTITFHGNSGAGKSNIIAGSPWRLFEAARFIDSAELSEKLHASNYTQAVQMVEIEEICRRMEAKQDNLVNYISRGHVEPMPADPIDQKSELETQNVTPRMVRVTVIIRNSTKFATALLLTSLATWTYSDFPIVNPFISLLGLAACPFFFWIARSIENEEAQN